MPTKKNEEEIEIAEIAATEDNADDADMAAEEALAESAEVSGDEGTAKKAKPARKPSTPEEPVVKEVSGDTKKRGKRAERIGIVASDKMTKTVTVRVDRLVKHPMYRKYIKRRKNFMAHDELGARMGDKVRIVETRPLSARKRWRVVEIIQRAEL